MRRRTHRMPVQGKILLFFFFFLIVLFLLNSQLRPVVESVAVNEARIKSVNTINQAVVDELEKDRVTYNDLIQVERGNDENVLAITTNMVKMNALKAKIITAVQNDLSNDTCTTVYIPVGTLLGGDVFHGRGPSVPLKATLSGNVTAEFKSSFETAGINQTKHQIYFNIHTSVYSFLPGFDTTTDVNTNILVAETVIVGQVPQVVANLK